MSLRTGTPEEVGMSPDRVRVAADLAARLVAQERTPALVVLAARRGIVVLHEAHGHLTPEPGAPRVERDTIFPLASITKPIAATAVMILVEDGLLGLNRPVAEYIPEFQGEGKSSVMVHHLLTHTSGFNDEQLETYVKQNRGTLAAPPPVGDQPPYMHEWLGLRYQAPLSKPPGVEMSYCDYGYRLLGEIVRRVSGQSVSEFAAKRIFEPLRMIDTSFGVRESSRSRLVRRRMEAGWAVSLGSEPGLETPTFQHTPWANGAAYSTAMDMAIFAQMFLDRGCRGDVRILSPASVTEMTRNQIPGIPARDGDELFPEAGWGLGWDIHGTKRGLRDGSLYSPASFCHGGSGGMSLWVDPVHEIVGCYFSVQSYQGARVGSPHWGGDLFINVITAAVMEV